MVGAGVELRENQLQLTRIAAPGRQQPVTGKLGRRVIGPTARRVISPTARRGITGRRGNGLP
jgi:hypothetical protein